MNEMEIPINRLALLKLILDLADQYTQFSDGENEKAQDLDFGVGKGGNDMQSLTKMDQLLVELLQQFHGIHPKMRYALIRNPLARIDVSKYLNVEDAIDPFEPQVPVLDSTYSPNVESESMSKN